MLESKDKALSELENLMIREMIKAQLHAPNISFFTKIYQEEVVDSISLSTEQAKRKKSNLSSFLKTIRETEIDRIVYADKPLQHEKANILKRKKIFGEIYIEDFTEYDVNQYIVARLELGKKSSTVSREISILSQIFEHCKHSNPHFKGIVNPVILRNKKLLSGRKDKKPKKRLTESDKLKLFKVIDSYANPDLKNICLLSLATAMRRSEIVNLKWGQVHNTYIHLPSTKSTSRDVHLTEEAKELLNALPRGSDSSKVFPSYSTVAGFEGSFSKLMRSSSLSHITFHQFRKEAFSMFYEQLGAGNATVICSFLGVRNLRKFIELHKPRASNLDSEEKILQSGGHTNGQLQLDHYLTINLNKKLLD